MYSIKMNPKSLEATREKENAEKMMISNDYINARDKLIRARNLYPEMENIGSMIAVCEILSAAIELTGFGIDYYCVLQLTTLSTFEHITCRYQKLVAMLQPLRCKFPGTELALKLLQEAFSVLSNQEKRSAFDLKLGASYEILNVQATFCNSISNKQTGCADQSFSEFNMDCSNDEGAHMLLESDTTLGGIAGAYHNNIGEKNYKLISQKRFGQDFHDFDNDRKADNLEAGEIWAAHYRANLFHNCRYAHVDINSEPSVSMTWLKPVPISVGESRWCDAGLPVACGSFELDPELTDNESWPTVSSHKCVWVPDATHKQYEIYPKRGEIWALYKDWSLDEWAYNPENLEGCRFKLVEMLSDFSKYFGADGACLMKVDGFRSIYQRQTIDGSPIIVYIPPTNLYMFSHNVPAYRFMGGEIDEVVNGMFELDLLALPDTTIQGSKSREKPKKENSRISSFTPKQHLHMEENELSSLSWLPNDFAAGQIWAVYCRNDSMPRKFTRINCVISERQVCVTFLEPLTSSDYEINWKKEDLPIVCGVFKVGEASVNLDMSQFSHPVKCQRSTDETLYNIYPLRGEVWAMYKNLNRNCKRSDHDRYQCGIVEILSDFSEGNEIRIAKLGEVKGCLTFFHRQQYEGFDLTHVVSRSNMLNFSHCIPAFRVPGIGKYGIPENLWHLEPNALPPRITN